MSVYTNLYTPTVQRVFKGIKSPYPVIVDIVEHPYARYLELRVYRDNIESFSEPQKIAIATYLFQLRDALRGIPNVQCHIQGVEYSPPARRRDH